MVPGVIQGQALCAALGFLVEMADNATETKSVPRAPFQPVLMGSGREESSAVGVGYTEVCLQLCPAVL